MENIAIPKSSSARREWVKYRLKVLGMTLTQLGERLNVSRHAVGLALRKPYPRMERAIAAALGLEPSTIWPERYDADGNPNRPLGRPKNCITPTIENHKTAAGRNGYGRRSE